VGSRHHIEIGIGIRLERVARELKGSTNLVVAERRHRSVSRATSLPFARRLTGTTLGVVVICDQLAIPRNEAERQPSSAV